MSKPKVTAGPSNYCPPHEHSLDPHRPVLPHVDLGAGSIWAEPGLEAVIVRHQPADQHRGAVWVHRASRLQAGRRVYRNHASPSAARAAA